MTSADKKQRAVLRERARRKAFTPEQKAAASEHSRLYMQHRRLHDADYRDRVRAATKRLYRKHRDKRVEAMAEKHRRTRMQCLSAYGGICACCGETEHRFLTLDHLQDRRESPLALRVGGSRMGQALYSWLIRNQFPVGFQVLCYNCNCAKGIDGVCPHEAMRLLTKAG